MCQPTSNKDVDVESVTGNAGSSGSSGALNDPMESIASSFSSKALHLRDMTRRASGGKWLKLSFQKY